MPIVSGNVSLYNETHGQAILPTPTIGGVGLLQDWSVMARIGTMVPGDAVFVLGGVFRNIGNAIQVNGHTDPAPPDPARGYETNWELSMARAAAVANAFRQVGYEDAITAFGYADSRYETLPDVPEPERRRLARRVDVIVTPEVAGR